MPTTITSGGNGKERSHYDSLDFTAEEVRRGFGLSTFQGTVKVTQGELSRYFRSTVEAEEPVTPTVTYVDTIKAIIVRSEEILDDVIDIFDDDQIECINKFNMFGEQIKLLWAKREYVNESFKEVLVHLLAAIKSSQYCPFIKRQYEALRSALRQIENVNIDSDQVNNVLLTMVDGDIDLFAPIRNWEDYIVEVRRHDK